MRHPLTIPRRGRTVLAGLLLLLAIRPAAAWAWAGQQHVQVARVASRNMPEDAAAFRAFSRSMAFPSIYPDLWKGADSGEAPRHYFEPDRLPAGFDLLALNPDQDQAFTSEIPAAPVDIGIAPWTIVGLLGQMTDAMRTNDWLWAARCGAAMSHYVADLHMPLHCTRNFNGQETWQHGIHLRLESDMTRAFFHAGLIHPAPATHLPDPFRAVMEWIAHSASLVPDILKADIIAKRSAGGRVDTEGYYRKFWELTGDTVVQQLEDAATHLSSLWYTAWINAGQPAIPEPIEDLPPQSVFSGVGIDPPAEGQSLGVVRQGNRTFDIIIWSVMVVFAGIVIVSSLRRSIQARRAKGL
ncbi:MAG: hypothetical protein KBC66_05295 [Kiritimatiellae bacterium]|nr:hypothetical protein [Kiritimatiellia bacterium]NLD90295.1 hypothetical protein [Lentisphaerota bacterium]HPC20392.1 hypothetical protein [Kiritimatiellia bacterium]HQN81109.1 hypothetical protein [Kiritimatiellia bacterium]HQQ60497.1 hypothetical protein [Kiritimatiellia bacterium]